MPHGARGSFAARSAALILALLLACPARSFAQTAAPGAPAAQQVDIEKRKLRRGADSASASTQKSAAREQAVPPKLDSAHLTRVAIALAAVLGLILLLRFVARRFLGAAGTARSTRAVQVLSRSPVSPRQQLVLLRVGRRLLVVADGAGQMTTLSEISDPDEVAALIGQLQDDHADRAGRSFGNLFGKMRGTYEQEAERPAEPERQLESLEDDAAVASTRQELSGLMDKVRLLSRQFKS